jgi:hypothetical protein
MNTCSPATLAVSVPRFDLFEAPNRVRHLQEAPLGDRRIGSDDDQTLELVEVGEGLCERETVDLPCDRELVRAVLRSRGEHAGRADALHEALRKNRVQHPKAGRRADVHGNTIAPMAVDQLAHFAADTPERVVPTRALKLAVNALHGVEQSIGCVVHPMLLEPFEATVPARGYVVVVGLDVDDLVAIHRDLEPTKSLANPAKGLHCLGHD